MIADSRIDHTRRRITLVVGPTLELDELTAVITEHANLGVWHYDVLFDQRASSTVFSSDAVRTLVAHVQSLSRRHGRRGRLAIVPDDDASTEWLGCIPCSPRMRTTGARCFGVSRTLRHGSTKRRDP
jgi:hypothetical protein